MVLEPPKPPTYINTIYGRGERRERYMNSAGQQLGWMVRFRKDEMTAEQWTELVQRFTKWDARFRVVGRKRSYTYLERLVGLNEIMEAQHGKD